LVPFLGPDGAGQPLLPSEEPTAKAEQDCTFVAHLHVRKCSGTTVRNIFGDDLSSQGWTQSQGYCTPMSSHARIPENAMGKHWSETHCDEDITHFNEGVRALRSAIEPKGCKVISSVLLREPLAQLTSEWEYFSADTCETATPVDWARLVPEEELRWTMSAEQWWTSGLLHAPTKECQAEPSLFRRLQSCDNVTSSFAAELAQVDLVGISDTEETFAQWWLQLADLAGITVSDAQLVKHSNALNRQSDRARVAANTTSAQAAEIEDLNRCASRSYEAAKARHEEAVARQRSNGREFGDRVDALLGNLAHRGAQPSSSSEQPRLRNPAKGLQTLVGSPAAAGGARWRAFP